MTTIALRQRGRAGIALLAAGALLLSIAITTLGARPAEATFGGSHPACVGGTLYTIDAPGTQAFVFTTSVSTPEGVQVNLSRSALQGWRTVTGITVPSGYSATVWTYAGLIIPSHSEVTSVPHSRSTNIRHIDVCVVEDEVEDTTTTTEVEDTTTTTEVEETTTTTEVEETTTTTEAGDTTTTQVAGPGSETLPDTGAGSLLALLAGGLGVLLMGGGSLALASRRRQPIE